jgi:hypothetical protein
MRNSILLLCAALLCSGTFYFGLITGEARATNTTSMVLIGSSVLDKRTVMGLIRLGNSDGAERYINSSIDADLIQLNAVLEHATDKSLKARTEQTIAIVARDRAGRPVIKNQSLPEVDARVNSILSASRPLKLGSPPSNK